MKRHRLSHQIALSMSAVAVIAVLLVFVGFSIFYAALFALWPPPPGPPPLLPTGPDYLLTAVFLLICLIIAIFIALRLARRILTPLNSVAESARKLSAGDLTARATPGDRSLGETARLVDDFNVMAQKLQESAEAMMSWNAAIAHELRTPLTILRGRLQGLSEGVFEPSNELIRTLLAQVDGLSRLVEDLRIVTLSDSRRLEMRFETIDLEREMQQAVDAMRPNLAEAGLSIELITRPVILVCDAVRIRQALLALLDNACRYAKPGLLQVSMRVDNDGLVIAVEDQGPGLPPDFSKRAFDAFARAEPSRSRESGGSGLGLSVVRAIAEAHHGKVGYKLSATGGSIFEIALPVTSLRS